MSQGIRYRSEIDGLRALAVLAVIIFHAKLGLLSGGFVGVDVFFVISGYLITSIIMHEDADRGFSLARFYERRIRRIFPALFVVVMTSFAAGAVFFTPQDFTALARSAIAAMAFFSNFHFSRQAGYFAPASETQPLLHTWSLGVEEQFYLVAPFLIIALNRYLKNYRAAIILVLMLLSLVAAMYGIHNASRSVFYMPHTRAFELLIGVALAMHIVPVSTNERINDALGWGGLALIAGAVVLFNAGTPFPGPAALVPTIGTAMVIHSATAQRTKVAQLLSFSPIVSFGKISYSLYLWHWPLLAFAEYEYGEILQPWHRVLLLTLAVVLSYLTYHWVEQPARRGTFGSRGKVFAGGLAMMAIVLGATEFVARNAGLPGRLPPQAQLLAKQTHEDMNVRRVCSTPRQLTKKLEDNDCMLGNAKAAPTFLLIGDSHTLSVARIARELAESTGINGRALTAPGCPPFFGLEAFGNEFAKCHEIMRRAEQLLDDPALKDVILVGRWAIYAEGARSPNEVFLNLRAFVKGNVDVNRKIFTQHLHATVKRFAEKGKRVTVIGPSPEMHSHVPAVVLKAAMRGESRNVVLEQSLFEQRQAAVFQALQSLEAIAGVTVTYPHKQMCSNGVCLGSQGNAMYYYDDNHLSPAGVKLFETEVKKAMGLSN